MRPERITCDMQLHLSSWPEIEKYLETSKAILIPIGSTEQQRAK
jgi:creatinine amidohydrolase/Fe(II)-dependent formamide hydrolase-like protein